MLGDALQGLLFSQARMHREGEEYLSGLFDPEFK